MCVVEALVIVVELKSRIACIFDVHGTFVAELISEEKSLLGDKSAKRRQLCRIQSEVQGGFYVKRD